MLNSALLFAQADGGGDGGGMMATVLMLVYLVVVVAVIAGVWKVFTKAGKPGWACLIPIYNLIVMCEIAGRPVWWFILFFIPCVGIIVAFVVMIDIAKAFGKDALFGIGLALLGFIFFPILGFGDAKYIGPQVGK